MSIVRVRHLDPDTGNPVERDEYGDPLDSVPDRLELHGCQVAPRSSDPNASSSQENHDHGRDGFVSGITLYSHDPRLDIVRGDQIEVDGAEFDVEGEPSVWGTDGLTVALRRSAG